MIPPDLIFPFAAVLGLFLGIFTVAVLVNSDGPKGFLWVIPIGMGFLPLVLAEGYEQYFDSLKGKTVHEESLGALEAVQVQSGTSLSSPITQIETESGRILTVESRFRSVFRDQEVTIRRAANGHRYLCIDRAEPPCNLLD